MSSIEPTPTRWPQPPRINIWRWLSPLLLVSLGLHGVSLLIPVPEEREVVEIEKIEEKPVSIQVADLPPGALEPEPIPVEEPPEPVEPPPPEPVELPPPEPVVLPQEPIEPIFTEQAPPLPPDPPGTSPSTPPNQDPIKQPTQQTRFDLDPNEKEVVAAAAFDENGIGIRNGFAKADRRALYEHPNVLSVQYEPEVELIPGVEQNICLQDPPTEPLSTSFLAIVKEDSLYEAQIVGRTGYDAVDDWISLSVNGQTDSTEVTPDIVYAAIGGIGGVNPMVEGSAGASPVRDENQTMYYFEIKIELPQDVAC